MTYKELYLKEHPECDIDYIVDNECPITFYPDDLMVDDGEDCPSTCEECWNREVTVYKKDTITKDDVLVPICDCYDILNKRCNGTRERDKCMCGGIEANCDFYPEKKTKATEKSDIQKTVEKIQECGFKAKDLVPVGEEVAKGLEKGILEPKKVYSEAFEKLMSMSSLKIGDPDELKNIENDEKVKALETANNIDDAVNKVILDPKLSLNENCKRLQLNWYNAIGVAGETAKKASETLAKTTSAILDSGSRREFSTGAVRDIQEGKGDMVSIPWEAILRLSVHYENGAKKYKRWNFRKGIPVSSYIDSACRHLAKYQCGCDDEDHLSAAAFNVLGAMFTENLMPELQDLPLREGKNTFDYFKKNI